MVEKGKIFSNGVVLNSESKEVTEFFESEKVKFTLLDQSLFDYMFDQFQDLESQNSTWTKTIEKPHKRVYHRKEDGLATFTMLSDSILDCPVDHLIACFADISTMQAMYKEFDDVRWVHRKSDISGLLYAIQKFPFPLSNRDLCVHVSGVVDYSNKGMLYVSKSLPIGASYFG